MGCFILEELLSSSKTFLNNPLKLRLMALPLEDRVFTTNYPLEANEIDFKVRYLEGRRLGWGWQYDGKLDVDVGITVPGIDDYARSFSDEKGLKFGISAVKKKRGEKQQRAKSQLSDTIINRLLEISEIVELPIIRRLSVDKFSEFETALVEKVSELMDLPEIAQRYLDIKSQKQQHLVEIEKMVRSSVVDKKRGLVKAELIAHEVEAMYKIATMASQGLDYKLDRDNLQRRVENLFDPNDNLLFRPIFKKVAEGYWARFINQLVGEGFYRYLKNSEQDLDRMYCAVLEKLSEKAINGERLTTGLYELTFKETNSLSDVLQVLEHERKANLELLARLKKITRANDYDQEINALSTRVMRMMSFSNGLITATEPGVPEFNGNYSVDDDFEAAQVVRRQMASDLEQYLKANDKKLRVRSGNTPSVRFEGELIKIQNSGDYNISMAVGSFAVSSLRYHLGFFSNSYKWHVQFKFSPHPRDAIPPVMKTTYTHLFEEASTIEQKYASPALAAERFIKLADDEIAKTKLKSNSKQDTINLIKDYHPYLDEEMIFVEKFYQGMVKRFTEMYQPRLIETTNGSI